MKALLRIAVLVCLTTFMQSALAQADKEVNYIPLKPSFVINYGANIGRLNYLKLDIQLRVETTEHTLTVERHIPYIRHKLIMFLSEQTEEAIATVPARQELRAKALVVIQEMLTEEEGIPIVTDLLFDNFVVQG